MPSTSWARIAHDQAQEGVPIATVCDPHSDDMKGSFKGQVPTRGGRTHNRASQRRLRT